MGDFGGFSSGGINVNDIFQMFGGGFGDDMGGMGGFPGFGGGRSSGRSNKSSGNRHFTFKFG